MVGRAAEPPKLKHIRRVALSMPAVEEHPDKHGPSFRVNGKTFALYWLPEARWILRLPHFQEMMLFEARPETFAPIARRPPVVELCCG
jgi:hypothetical protein